MYWCTHTVKHGHHVIEWPNTYRLLLHGGKGTSDSSEEAEIMHVTNACYPTLAPLDRPRKGAVLLLPSPFGGELYAWNRAYSVL